MAKKYLDDAGVLYFWGKLKDYFQVKLVSGTNIKTINNESLLGSGNITISGGSATGADYIIDQGQETVSYGNGYWRWHEWHSGKVEAWYSGSITLNQSGSSSGGVNRYLRRVTLPNNYALYKCACVINGTLNGGWLNCGGLFNSSSVHVEPYTTIEVMAYRINSVPDANQTNVNIYVCGEKNA